MTGTALNRAFHALRIVLVAWRTSQLFDLLAYSAQPGVELVAVRQHEQNIRNHLLLRGALDTDLGEQ